MKKRNSSLWRSVENAFFARRPRHSMRRRGTSRGRKCAIESLEQKMLLAANLTLDSSDADVSVEAEDAIVYTFDYSNTGDMTASGVVINTRVPHHTTFDENSDDAGWVCSTTGSAWASTRCSLDLGDVAAGVSDSVTFPVTVDQDLSSRVRKIYNFARISDGGQGDPDPNRFDNYARETTPILRQLHDLQITMTGDAELSSDGSITYTIDYTNAGVVAANGATITLRVPRHTTFDQANSDQSWTCDQDNCTLVVGDVQPGQGGSATFTVDVDADLSTRVRRIYASARIGDDGTGVHDANRWNNHAIERTSVARALPDVSLLLDDGDISVSADSPLIYTLTYANQGTVAASGATITLRLPRHTTFDSGASSVGWNCDQRLCTFDVGDLAVGESATVTFAVTVDAALSNRVRNIYAFAKIRHDGQDGNRFNNYAYARTPVANT